MPRLNAAHTCSTPRNDCNADGDLRSYVVGSVLSSHAHQNWVLTATAQLPDTRYVIQQMRSFGGVRVRFFMGREGAFIRSSAREWPCLSVDIDETYGSAELVYPGQVIDLEQMIALCITNGLLWSFRPNPALPYLQPPIGGLATYIASLNRLYTLPFSTKALVQIGTCGARVLDAVAGSWGFVAYPRAIAVLHADGTQVALHPDDPPVLFIVLTRQVFPAPHDDCTVAVMLPLPTDLGNFAFGRRGLVGSTTVHLPYGIPQFIREVQPDLTLGPRGLNWSVMSYVESIARTFSELLMAGWNESMRNYYALSVNYSEAARQLHEEQQLRLQRTSSSAAKRHAYAPVLPVVPDMPPDTAADLNKLEDLAASGVPLSSAASAASLFSQLFDN